MHTPDNATRRRLLQFTGAASMLALPSLARAALPAMTEGPFYPSIEWRARQLDWDADLTRVTRSAGAEAPRASGEWLDFGGAVVDVKGRPIDGADVEVWQCDVHGSYRHPNGAGEKVDEGFQGFGSTRSDARGLYRFRTIRPVPYPGRTPHIHVRVRHRSFGELTSQLFVAGDAGNARDFIYRSLSDAERAQVDMRLERAAAGAPTRWVAQRSLVVGV
ncbi:intradiol ring-cleavage dioxygenase [Piscinibacter sp. HJYY11]|uniref:dioxygenase family protein n=1 Tax=Piscinibacter sp. HJYY11 TaxID=2801333 RepID=UPI00191F9066|nr:intradiol ring-cleavage dioxygenase [Piscinibacter sp. HJYY11]MBL0730081.1 intradiol ring-cleavage dioxygenase [Piscinibacter sp. HJYY11]